VRRATLILVLASVLLIGAAGPAVAGEKGGAEDNWPAPLVALLVVAILLVIGGVAYTVLAGRTDRRSQEH
jgi:cyanate permease